MTVCVYVAVTIEREDVVSDSPVSVSPDLSLSPQPETEPQEPDKVQVSIQIIFVKIRPTMDLL